MYLEHQEAKEQADEDAARRARRREQALWIQRRARWHRLLTGRMLVPEARDRWHRSDTQAAAQYSTCPPFAPLVLHCTA